MSVFILKLIAIITMAIDHTTEVVYSYGLVEYDKMLILRGIGRMAFPIYVFLIGNGWNYTKNKNKYLINMIVFAFISQLPFTWALFYNPNTQIFNYFQLNVFFTLAFGVYSIYVYEYLRKNNKLFNYLLLLPLLLPIFLIKIDYGILGVIFIFVLYLAKSKLLKAGVIFLWGFLQYNSPDPTFSFIMIGFVVLSIICIYLYNGKKGTSINKYYFYAFYPVHLLILAAISLFYLRLR